MKARAKAARKKARAEEKAKKKAMPKKRTKWAATGKKYGNVVLTAIGQVPI